MIVLYLLEDEENEVEWPKAAACNPAFAFLKEEEEIYTLADGKPFHDQG